MDDSDSETGAEESKNIVKHGLIINEQDVVTLTTSPVISQNYEVVKFAESEDESTTFSCDEVTPVIFQKTGLRLPGLDQGLLCDEDEAYNSNQVKFAESEDEGTSTLACDASNAGGVKVATSGEDQLKGVTSPKMVPLPNKVFGKKMCPKVFKLSVKKNCSKFCVNKCETIVASWSPEKILDMKNNLKGVTSTESKNKLLNHLHYQKKFHVEAHANGLVYNGHSFCKPFLSFFLGLSYYMIKTVFRDYCAGLVRYVHGNVENIRETLAAVKCTSWFLVHIAIHGQKSPDEILTVLPSYMTKAELFRTYLQETSGRTLKRSSFYKHFKNKFGSKRQDKNLPQIRISRYSSHSVCDTCLGLDNFQRTCKNEDQLKFCQGLKQNHKIRFGGARVEIYRLIQLGIQFSDQWFSFQLDGMDNSKSTIPRFLEKGKKFAGSFRLPCKISGGIIWSSLYPGNRKNKMFVNHDHYPNSSNMIVSIVFLMLKDVLADHKFLPKCLHINLDNCGLLFMHAKYNRGPSFFLKEHLFRPNVLFFLKK